MATTFIASDAPLGASPTMKALRRVADVRSGFSAINYVAYVRKIYAPSTVEAAAQEALQITRGQIFPRSR